MGLAHTLMILAWLKSKLEKFLSRHAKRARNSAWSLLVRSWSPGQRSLTCGHPVKWCMVLAALPNGCWALWCLAFSWGPLQEYDTEKFQIVHAFQIKMPLSTACTLAEQREGKTETGWCSLSPGHNPPETLWSYRAFPYDVNPTLRWNQFLGTRC